MKKILLAIDGSNYSKGAFEFANWLNSKQKILLVGLFVPKTVYANLWTYGDANNLTNFIPVIDDIDSPEILKTIQTFENNCIKNDIEFRVHKNYDSNALDIISKESRFADLLILGSETFYKNYIGKDLSENLKETLHEIECPAIVVPEKYNFPKTNIIAYDGSKSSVYSLKQFIYLFPELLNNNTLLVNSSLDYEKEVQEQILIEELCIKHFSNFTIYKNKNEPENYFNSLILKDKHPIIISGSFGKGGLGKLLHKSFMSDIIKEHHIPVFITHK